MFIACFEMLFFMMLMGWMISSCFSQKDKSEETKKIKRERDKFHKQNKTWRK